MQRSFLGLAAAVGLLVGTSAANATTNLVVNGDFEQFSSSSAAQVESPNDTSGATLTGWTNAGYTYLFTPGSAYTTGSASTEYNNSLYLWGPGTGGGNVNNGMTATSPTGGNFIGSDGAYQPGAISQSVSGLTVGGQYYLTFWWAAGQQQSYTGNTTEAWGVTFGSQTFNTATVNNPSEGFQPWTQQFFSFIATSTTQTLSFLAAGTPSGTPPFSLLDGIVLVAPEPASWALFGVGLVVVMSVTRLRPRQATRRAGDAKV